MKIAIIGDLFVRTTFFEEYVRRHVGPLVDTLEIVSAEYDWPGTPLQHNAEVKEFVGAPQAVIDLAHNAEVLLVHTAPVTQAVIDGCPQLQLVGCCRGGPVNINLAAARQRGITVVNAPARNAQAVIEFTIGLILTEYRGIARAHKVLSSGIWQGELYRYDRAGRELRGQTIGLVGFGAIAQGLVPYLKPFGMRIQAFDPYTPQARFDELEVVKVDLLELLRTSDIVSIHARVTQETIGLIRREQFALMKPGSYFINTARGPLVDNDALYEALASGHLGGAGLDTFSLEPPPADWPLLRLPNVTLTPHIAGCSRQSAERGAESLALDLANFLAGRPIKYLAG
jgi:D-3-phosphoglycerate dehydrogenase